jgi:hypothetical protein
LSTRFDKRWEVVKTVGFDLSVCARLRANRFNDAMTVYQWWCWWATAFQTDGAGREHSAALHDLFVLSTRPSTSNIIRHFVYANLENSTASHPLMSSRVISNALGLGFLD